ncbi:MAG: DUF3592 domain-containing protein [Tannerellaceae bacterium]|nr:DUF3592 domain-containing protein [Tannerellaceae bacterium]
MVVFIVLSVVGLLVVTGGYAGLAYTNKISRKYIPVKAKVVYAKRHKSTYKGRARYYYEVRVTYRIKTGSYETVLDSSSPSMKMGDYLTIHYNPDKPDDIVAIKVAKGQWKTVIRMGFIFIISSCALGYFVLNYLGLPIR